MGKKKAKISIVLSIIAIIISCCGCFNANTDVSPVSVTEPVTTLAAKNIATPLEVHVIDVGQGDSILVKLPNEKNMLIDAGDRNSGDGVAGYIENQGITKLDYVIATHPHEDHIGGMNTVIEKFAIENFYMPNKAHTTKVFENLLIAIQSKGLNTSVAQAGEVIFEGDNLSARFVAPAKDYGKGDFNNASAVILLKYKNRTFLFTGDAELESEQDMINGNFDIKADVLKVAHHGSNTSTSDAFIKVVNPKFAIISCGKENSYGHPSYDTIKTLENVGAKIFRTDEIGTIVITSDGELINID